MYKYIFTLIASCLDLAPNGLFVVLDGTGETGISTFTNFIQLALYSMKTGEKFCNVAGMECNETQMRFFTTWGCCFGDIYTLQPIQDRDLAQRLRVIPFNEKITIDPHFFNKTLRFAKPFLIFLIHYYMSYCQGGLSPVPEIITEHTRPYYGFT